MCDTIGKIISNNYAIFGKNSDRAVNEPQVVEFYEAKDYILPQKLKCTYIEIEQVAHTNAIVLSRPTWIWGGEIGVNDKGVCIGNEAVFTKGKYGNKSLIGMDYLRLALERSSSAKAALDTIVSLLKVYGQGGNCGYDTNFEYNNSFLIMDKNEIFVLETVGKKYTYKRYNHVSISNCLSIEEDGDFYSENKENFKKKNSDLIMTFGACGAKRKALSFNQKLENKEDMMKILSAHQEGINPFKTGSVASVCMHAANQLTADQTTSSMIIELKNDDIFIYLTGSSLPCISLFKPAKFMKNGLIFANEKGNEKYWLEHEKFNRKLLSSIIPKEFYLDKISCQNEINNLSKDGFSDEIITKCVKIDEEFFDRWKDKKFEKVSSNFIYKNFWSKKNRELK